jgi:hypothetical protein
MQKINVNFKVDKSKLPPPGILVDFINLLGLEGDSRTNNERLNDQSFREFEVHATLTKDKSNFFDTIGSLTNEDGQSFFQLPNKAKEIIVESTFGKFIFEKNSKNELSLIKHKCKCSNWNEAFSKFYEGVAPLLDFLSFSANCPVNIEKMICWDWKNDSFAVNYIVPYSNNIIQPFIKELHNEMKPIYALYREAKNNNSYYYKFLCYYKILEGTYTHLRPEFMKRIKQNRIAINTIKETLPNNNKLDNSHKPLIGKSIKDIYDNVLTKEFRNVVAHYFIKDSDVLNVSDYKIYKKFNSIILLSELCSRVVIETQNQYYDLYKSKINN